MEFDSIIGFLVVLFVIVVPMIARNAKHKQEQQKQQRRPATLVSWADLDGQGDAPLHDVSLSQNRDGLPLSQPSSLSAEDASYAHSAPAQASAFPYGGPPVAPRQETPRRGAQQAAPAESASPQWGMPIQPSIVIPPSAAAPEPVPAVVSLFSGQDGLARAVIMAELLGRPRALKRKIR